MAVESQNLDIIKYLLSFEGLSVNDPDLTGLTPLFVACHNGSTSLVKFLLESKASIRVRGPKNSSLLHAAVERDFL